MDQALAEDFEADKLDYLQHVHEELPSLSLFQYDHLFKEFVTEQNALFSLPLDTCYLTVLFEQHLTFQSHTCSPCLMAAIQCQQITPKIKANRHCL